MQRRFEKHFKREQKRKAERKLLKKLGHRNKDWLAHKEANKRK